ncbi:MAG: glutamyl-tRNA reductase [Burkholderiaceae bacterium]
MELFAFGLNHQSAPLALRERLAFPGEALRASLSELRQVLGRHAPEQALVSTCNRTELYLASPSPAAAQEQAIDWLAHRSKVPADDLISHLYQHQEQQAVRHVFRVASGLDSMVLGEPQILGQLKQAAREAQDVGSLGSNLHHLFQQAFSVAKEVRSNTEIGAHSISMAAASVKLAQRIFGDLSKTTMLFIGAGEMIQLCISHFAAQRPTALAVANRTVHRGEALAREYGGRAIALAELPERLAEFDIVVSCTASSLPIVGLGMVERALKKRRHRPLFMVDLAVPRDIEAEVAQLSDAFVYTVDDLAELVKEGVQARQHAVGHAEAIIDHGVQSYLQWKSVRAQVPLIKSLTAHAEKLQSLELQHAQRLLARGEPVEDVLKALAHSMSQKLLHGAYASLSSPDVQTRDRAAEMLPELFGFDLPPPPNRPH